MFYVTVVMSLVLLCRFVHIPMCQVCSVFQKLLKMTEQNQLKLVIVYLITTTLSQ